MGEQLGAPAIWILPVAFPLVMACGGFLGLIGIPLPGVEIGIGASALLLGITVAGEIRPKNMLWAALLVGFFGLFHGHAHGTELPAGEYGLFYSLGFVISTGVLHECGIAVGEVRRWSAETKVLRVMGGALATANGDTGKAPQRPIGEGTGGTSEEAAIIKAMDAPDRPAGPTGLG